MTLRRGEPTPNAERLASGQGVLEALGDDWTLGAQLPGDCDCLAPHDRVGNVLREVHLWEPFARYFADTVNGYQQVAVWMSLVEHKLKCRRY